MQQDTKRDCTGQQVYVGLDVSQTHWLVSIHTAAGEYKTFHQQPEVEPLIGYLHRTFPHGQYHAVYEAGYCGFWIYEQLRQRGIDCVVVNPADVPTRDKEHAHKTDPVDARKLARGLRTGELDALYVPSRLCQEHRSLVRLRQTMVRKQTRCKNQIKAHLSFYGIDVPEAVATTHWSRAYIGWLEQTALHCHHSGTVVLQTLLSELQSLRGTIATVTKYIRQLALNEPYKDAIGYLRTIDGISILSGMIFLTEIVDIERFGNTDRLASYCGIVPGEYSSGNRTIVTGMLHRGNTALRTMLIECAWVAIRTDPALKQAFAQLNKRQAKAKAIVHIARKLLNRMYFVLKHRQAYRPCAVG